MPPAPETLVTLTPIRVTCPRLPTLSPNHVDSRLAIRSGPPPTSVLCAWVVNRESVRVERYFYEDRHKDGASFLETLSFQEAEISSDGSARRAYKNFVRHSILTRQELELKWELGRLGTCRPLNDDIKEKYSHLYIDILNLRLAISETADSVRFLPGTHRFQYIKSYRTIATEAAEEELRDTQEGTEILNQIHDLTAISEEE